MKNYKATTQQEIRAIKASIRHWQDDCLKRYEKRMPVVAAMDVDNCAICRAFEDIGNNCPNCHLAKIGKNCNLNGSPYNIWKKKDNILMAIHHFEYGIALDKTSNANNALEAAKTAAKNMISTLKSLLPAKERKGRYK